MPDTDECQVRTKRGIKRMSQAPQRGKSNDRLYSADERRRRDASPWTLVQGVLAPLQFVVFLASTWLVWRYLATGEGAAIATARTARPSPAAP